VATSVDLEPLIQAASALEDERFEQGFSDCEGLGVSTRPPSPLTECETDAEPESCRITPKTSLQTPASVGQMKKNVAAVAAKNHRAKKRAKTAASGPPAAYAYVANPSTVKHHVKESDAIHVAADAGGFSAAGSGSWVGKRKDGVKKTPWTVPELLDEGFEVIEWDGR
jgi:hypothetical protein